MNHPDDHDRGIDRGEAIRRFEQFLDAMGMDPENLEIDDEHTEGTAKRVVDSRIDEIFRGVWEDPTEHLETTFPASGDYMGDAGWVIVDGIQVQSMCAHHFLPFRGRAHVGYIPDDEEVGLSKLARVTDGYARRPQTQEHLTNQIADAIHDNLDPVAVMVVLEAEHECMCLRGVQEPDAMTRTSTARGKAHPSVNDDAHTIKSEFLDLVGNGGYK